MSETEANPTASPRKGFGLTLLGLLLIVGGVIFFQSDLFLLRNIRISGHTHLSQQELLERTGLNGRINIFQLNLKRMEKRFLLIPQIQKVALERRLPDTLEIDLTERTTFCLVSRNDGLLEVGMDGIVIKKWSNDRPLTFPVVMGLRTASLSGGPLERFDDPLFRQNIAILKAAGDKLRKELSEVDLVRYRLFTKDSIQVELGDPTQLVEKMTALKALLAGGDRTKIIGIDLRVPNQPVVLTEKGVSNP